MIRPPPVFFLVLAVTVSLLSVGSRLIRRRQPHEDSTPEDVIDDS